MYKYSLIDIMKFPVGTKFKDSIGNVYKIYKDEKHHSKTLKYAVVTERLINDKFEIIEG